MGDAVSPSSSDGGKVIPRESLRNLLRFGVRGFFVSGACILVTRDGVTKSGACYAISMRILLYGLIGLLISACCSQEQPEWQATPEIVFEGGSARVYLPDLLVGASDEVMFTVDKVDGVYTTIEGDGWLQVDVSDDWTGAATLTLGAHRDCGGSSYTTIAFSDTEAGTSTGGACTVRLTYAASEEANNVSVAGSFNDWSTDSDFMTRDAEGNWVAELSLTPGAYPYKFVEISEERFGQDGLWSCDPNAPYIHCDQGVVDPWENNWEHTCGPGLSSCNSMLVVDDCERPSLEVESVRFDPSDGSVDVTVRSMAGRDAVVTGEVSLNGVPIEGAWDGERFHVMQSGLDAARYTLRFAVTDAQGRTSDEVVVPFWLDDWTWDEAVVYFAFVDRMANGDTSRDVAEGATAELGEYLGGDFEGVRQMLPYLDDLGVSVLWLSNAQDNAEADWAGDCDATYTGYHAYWPDRPKAVEEHFGGEQELTALIDAAHARGMRVVMDWVANHVHEDHPYALEHPEWFNPQVVCKDTVDGVMNFDRIPETCWFAPYLPDIDYGQAAPLAQMIDDAMWWTRAFDLDGFRVDAVKHMTHAVPYNLNRAIERDWEYREQGGNQRFWTIGETFDGYERINAYIGDDQLDGQFDFPLYYALRAAFTTDSITLPELMETVETSEAVFEGAQMSNFLGNHDVSRWITDAVEDNMAVCTEDGALRVADPVLEAWAMDRLVMAWTWLFTQKAAPLIYYGDEIGMPGYADPDNRQPLWWHLEQPETLASVDDAATRVASSQAKVLRAVRELAAAREAHPTMRQGPTVNWWYEEDVYGFARSNAGDHMLALFNRQSGERTLQNGLMFAGLPPDATYVDVLTGDLFYATSDQLTVSLGPHQSRLLVVQP